MDLRIADLRPKIKETKWNPSVARICIWAEYILTF